jgi:glyoxylase-like metal-dependent hydrolase (beta-lactamase superfamily II)
VSEAAASRPRRQEQQPASNEVAELAPGVLRIQLPIEFTGLGHVNCYVLVDKKGAAVIDAGLPGKKTWRHLQSGLRQAGLSLSDVHTVIVTHSHPDHFGSAGRLAHEAGAALVAESSFKTWLEPRQTNESPYLEALRARRTPWGGSSFPISKKTRLTHGLARHHLMPAMRPPIPNRRLSDGEVIVLAGREWQAVHTPGHTGDHLCLYDPTERLLLSGDHVLPTITPHVGGISPLADPLGSFLSSLAKLSGLGPVTTVLPAHGQPFSSLSLRVRQIVEHHDTRLAELRQAGDELGEASVVEFSRRLFDKRLWGMMAESETFAHLEFLRLRGEAERFERPEGQLAYRVDPGGVSSAREVAGEL